jgi:hypothetical protein
MMPLAEIHIALHAWLRLEQEQAMTKVSPSH